MKATFKDSEENMVKELIHIFCYGNSKELLINVEKQLLKLQIDTKYSTKENVSNCAKLEDENWKDDAKNIGQTSAK